MQTDPNNKIVKLCAEGMNQEGSGEKEKAYQLFRQAWEESKDDFERFISAHYLARQQPTIKDKLKWDETALQLALKINDENVKGAFPSLYLNIGKCYEDLNNFSKARENYERAFSFTDSLNEDGYGKMIQSAIVAGLERVASK